jgi:tetratricopeptide (TPR) repeat protein
LQNYENLLTMQRHYLKLFVLFFLCFIQIADIKAQNDIAKNADSLFNANNYVEAAKLYESLVSDGSTNKENIYLKLAYINESISNYPKAIYNLNNYYNLNPDDIVFEKMNRMALENKYQGFERNDLNFVLMIYQQYYIYILYLFLIVGIIILVVLVRKHNKKELIMKRHLIIFGIYLAFLTILINVPSTYQSAIVNQKSFLRSNPTSASPIIGSIKEGNKINIFGQESVWLKVLLNRKIVYIHQNDTWILEN